MICKLCHQSKVLTKSHIISEAFYKQIYDNAHRALPISMEDTNPRLIQKGIWEKLLCKECEQKLSKWENILKKTLVGMGDLRASHLTISHISSQLLKFERIAYKEFKLATLSMLWRMSIASHSFFSSYRLGIYDERLRKLLLAENAPGERAYPITVSRYELDGVFDPAIIMGFPPGKYDQRFTIQQFVVWGHLFQAFVNDRHFPRLPIEAFPRSSGDLIVDRRSIAELASADSVLSKINDQQVVSIYERLR